MLSSFLLTWLLLHQRIYRASNVYRRRQIQQTEKHPLFSCSRIEDAIAVSGWVKPKLLRNQNEWKAIVETNIGYVTGQTQTQEPSSPGEWLHLHQRNDDTMLCVLTYLVGGRTLLFQSQPHEYNSNFTCHLNFSKLPLNTEEYIVLEPLNNFN